MVHKGLLTIEDLSNQEIVDVLDLAQVMGRDLRGQGELAQGYIMASLFFEPSTRTRGSFESAMNRLGGQTITTADARSSSLEKGESLADTMRVWSGYADLIVMRHPWEGAARLAADYADVPVVNAGDGGHEHPTQTLCDLFTLREEHGTLEGLRVALCGDLKNGRTVHSLTFALLRFGAQIIFVPGQGLELPDHVRRRIGDVYKTPIERVRPSEVDLGGLFADNAAGEAVGASLSAVYMTPSRPHQLAMHESDALVRFRRVQTPNAIYVTRMQKERIAQGQERGAYPRVDSRVMSSPALSKAIVMHPLPRVDELSTDMDADPRARYFHQARNGVPVRMALVSLLLGKRTWSEGSMDSFMVAPIEVLAEGLVCRNLNCASQRESKSCGGQVLAFPSAPPWFLCRYCERLVPASHFAYKGKRVYHPMEELQLHGVEQLSRLRFFGTSESAEAAGLVEAGGAPRAKSPIIEVVG